MKVGILDILTTPSRSWAETAYNGVLTKQYASITPQAIAVFHDPGQGSNMCTVGIETEPPGALLTVAVDSHRVHRRHPGCIQCIPHPN